MAASKNGKTVPGEIVIAKGTELERVHRLKILRGKKYRNYHLKLLGTFSELEALSRDVEGGRFGAIISAIQNLFNREELNFEGEMLPFALGMETDEEKEYLDRLTPMEQFMAYMEGATYIVNGAQGEDVQAALKK